MPHAKYAQLDLPEVGHLFGREHTGGARAVEVGGDATWPPEADAVEEVHCGFTRRGSR